MSSEIATPDRHRARTLPGSLFVVTITGALLAAACASSPNIQPSGEARLVDGRPNAAVVSTAGIEVVAENDAWSGQPSRFERVHPVLVTITNDGDVPVRVRARDFALVTGTGARLTGLAPFDVQGSEVEANDLPVQPYGALSFSYFRLGHGSSFGHGFHGVGSAHGFHDSGLLALAHTPTFTRIDLPTADMVSKALPERIVEPGERVAGFVYFPEVGDDIRSFRLEFDMVAPDAPEGWRAEATIPFTTEGDESDTRRQPGLLQRSDGNRGAAALDVW